MPVVSLTLTVEEANIVLDALAKAQIRLAELHTRIKADAERQLVQPADPEDHV